MNVELTKDAEYLLCTLYKVYSEKLKSGISKAQARCFGSSEDIFTNYLSEWLFEDVNTTCYELKHAEMLSILNADNIAYSVSLTDKAIIYMENRFKNNIEELLNFIANLRKIF